MPAGYFIAPHTSQYISDNIYSYRHHSLDQASLKNILVSDFTAAKKVMREAVFFFFLPDLENRIVSDFAVGKKVMRERFFFCSPV